MKQPGSYRGYVIHTSSLSTPEGPFSASYTLAKIKPDKSYGPLEYAACEGVFDTDGATHEAAYTAARKRVDSLT